jgi:hypothetical protein
VAASSHLFLCSSAENHPLVAAARRVAEDGRPVQAPGEDPEELLATLVGKEKASAGTCDWCCQSYQLADDWVSLQEFVADKAVPQPREFAAAMRRGRPVVVGRADAAAGHAVDVDLSEVQTFMCFVAALLTPLRYVEKYCSLFLLSYLSCVLCGCSSDLSQVRGET